MQISEVMTKRVDLASPEMTVAEAARIMRQDDIGALPVGANDRLAGMVTDRDIVMRGFSDGADPNATVGDMMSKGIVYCYEDDSLEDAGKAMAEHQVHRLPVLNRDKRLVGVVALADLARSGSDGERAAIAALKGISQPTGGVRS